jgi:hypothetical protein
MTPTTRSMKVVMDNEDDIELESKMFDGRDEDAWHPWSMQFQATASAKNCNRALVRMVELMSEDEEGAGSISRES